VAAAHDVLVEAGGLVVDVEVFHGAAAAGFLVVPDDGAGAEAAVVAVA